LLLCVCVWFREGAREWACTGRQEVAECVPRRPLA
jgi:hypothetical protein